MMNVNKFPFTGTAIGRLILLTLLSFGSTGYLHGQNIDFIRGADLSFLSRIEDGGGIYFDNGVDYDALLMFKNHGFNTVRLRLWHSPDEGYSGLEDVLTMSSRIKALDLKLLLDFHYSDTWADPAHQTTPAAWQGLAVSELADSVYHYTSAVLTALSLQETPPDYIQLGNEISCGMLWDTGRICEPFDNDSQRQNLLLLLTAASSAVHESLPPDHNVQTIIHYAD